MQNLLVLVWMNYYIPIQTKVRPFFLKFSVPTEIYHYGSKWTITTHNQYDWSHSVQKFQYYTKPTITSQNEPLKSIIHIHN